MTSLTADLIRIVLIVWLAGLVLVIAAQIMRAKLPVGGLFASRVGGPPDPERVAMLAITLLVMGGYAMQVLTEGAQCRAPGVDCVMPDAPDILLIVLAGTNTGYLAGKLTRK